MLANVNSKMSSSSSAKSNFKMLNVKDIADAVISALATPPNVLVSVTLLFIKVIEISNIYLHHEQFMMCINYWNKRKMIKNWQVNYTLLNRRAFRVCSHIPTIIGSRNNCKPRDVGKLINSSFILRWYHKRCGFVTTKIIFKM